MWKCSLQTLDDNEQMQMPFLLPPCFFGSQRDPYPALTTMYTSRITSYPCSHNSRLCLGMAVKNWPCPGWNKDTHHKSCASHGLAERSRVSCAVSVVEGKCHCLFLLIWEWYLELWPVTVSQPELCSGFEHTGGGVEDGQVCLSSELETFS